MGFSLIYILNKWIFNNYIWIEVISEGILDLLWRKKMILNIIWVNNNTNLEFFDFEEALLKE